MKRDVTLIKICLTFLVVYTPFIFWLDAGDSTRFFLIRATVDENKLEIDSFFNQTQDRAFFNGHYYSDKSPGISFLSIPSYFLWKKFYSIIPDDLKDPPLPYVFTRPYERTNNITYYYVKQIFPSTFILLSQPIIIFFTSILSSIFTIFLIYKISFSISKRKDLAAIASITYGLATVAFHYSLLFFGHAAGTFLIFLSFYLIYIDKNPKNFKILTAAILAGLAIFVEYPTMLFSLFMILYLYLRTRLLKPSLIWLIGITLGAFPLLAYNYIVFNSPFVLSEAHVDPITISHETPELLSGTGVTFIPDFNVIWRILVDTYRGILFYYPILIFALLGLYIMYKTQQLIAILILALFVVFLLIFSSFANWWHGWSFGFRHILPIIPFLMIPYTYFLLFLRNKNNKFLTLLFVSFLLISVFHNLVGLVGEYEDYIKNVETGGMKTEYKEKLGKFVMLANPLYDFYLPWFINQGPRSLIFEELALNTPIDIRSNPYSMGTSSRPPYINIKGTSIYLFSTPFGFLTSELKYLIIFVIGFLAMLIWHKELIKLLGRYHLFGIIIVVILFLLAANNFKIEGIYLSKNWYFPDHNSASRFMSQNGEIWLYSDRPKNVTISLQVDTFQINRTLYVYLNNEGVISKHIISGINNIIKFSAKLENGKNTIRLNPKEGCTKPFITGIQDVRCLSILLNHIDVR